MARNKRFERLKYETASELGVNIDQGGNLTTRDAGSVGGRMVQKMIQAAETQFGGTTTRR